MENFEERQSPTPRNNGGNKRNTKKPIEKYLMPIGLALIAVLLVACIVVASTNGAFDQMLNPTVATDPTTPPTEPPTEGPTDPPVDISALAQELISETDFIAAGYDYDKAITMLQAFEYADQSAEVQAKIAQYQADKAKCSRYTKMNTITHIFVHPLIVEPDRAFGAGANLPAAMNRDMTTVEEFRYLLQSMYDRGYVLVTPYQVAYEVTDASGNAKFVEGDIYLPEGKKPFILSEDDVNYYGKWIADARKRPGQTEMDGVNNTPVFANKNGDGVASRIVIGADGKPTCEYVDRNGNTLVGEYDLVPILEAFIQEHPDFAYQSARAVLAVTGFEGVFGYRTKPGYQNNMTAEAYEKEVADAKAVVQCLKDNGWIIASHSYGHPSYGNLSASRIKADDTKFQNTVGSIIGECDILIYPNGSDIAGIEKYTFDNDKFEVLYKAGYRYFFNVDGSDYWVQMGDNYYRGGRRNVDGYRMWNNPYMLDDLMDVKTIQYSSNGKLVQKEVAGAWDTARPAM